MHQCDLGKNIMTGRDRVVHQSADCTQTKLFGWLRPKKRDQCLHLQQPLKNAATDVVISSIVEETSDSSQAGEHSVLSSSY